MTVADKITRAKTDYDEVYEAGYCAGQSSMVDESKLIPKAVSGSYISIDDVSEIPHSVGCKVESVNLLPYPWVQGTRTAQGVTFTDNGDGTLTINGTATGSFSYTFIANIDMPLDGDYTFSWNADKTLPPLLFYIDDASPTSIAGWSNTQGGENRRVEGKNACYIRLWITNGYTFDNVTIKPMLTKGTTTRPFTPYVSPESMSVTRTGANLFGLELVKSYNTAHFTIADDIITNNYGIYNGTYWLTIKPIALPAGTYRLSFDARKNRADGSLGMCTQLRFSDGTTTGVEANMATLSAYGTWERVLVKAFTLSEDKVVTGISFQGRNKKDDTVDDTMDTQMQFRNIMLNRGSTATEYEPYNGQTITPNADGAVEGMTSVSPYMNVFADTEGVNVEVEYNKSWGMQTEYDRFWDGYQDNGNRTNYDFAFAGSGWNDRNFKPKYDIRPAWQIVSAFYNCRITDLEAILNDCGVTLDTSNNANYGQVFRGSTITVLPEIWFSKSATALYATFAHCTSLHTIKKLTFEEGITQAATDTFQNCISLANVEFAGVIANNIDMQWCPLTRASIESLFSILSDTVSGKTLTLNKAAKEAAFTDDEWTELVATKANWTIELV